jgi:uncharacterized membrane protein
MSSQAPPSGPPDPTTQAAAVGPLRAVIGMIQARIVSGLLLALPIVLTFWIIYWLYSTLKGVLLDPITDGLRYVLRHERITELPWWWDDIVAPVVAIILVLGFLYFLGLFVRSSLHRAIDWVLLHVPVVTTIYRAVSNVVQSLGDQGKGPRFQRVVLVEFPHPGMRALAFVTNALRDATTDRTILCVCVLTGVVPPAGFTLFVPEESVTDLDWTVNQTLQAILSGGITAPASVHYFRGLDVSQAAGPIIDPHGHPIDSRSTSEGPIAG